MSFLDRIKAALREENHKDWLVLSDKRQISKLIDGSFSKPVIIFKHSTSCGLSASAKHRLESVWDELEWDVDFYYLDLLSNRSLSNEIANEFKVIHQSPQIIIIKNGEAIFNSSHHRVHIHGINDALDSYK